MDNAGFGERVYSAAKMAAVVDALLECGVPADEALDGCDVSFEQLHSLRTQISRNQLIRCYRNAIALSRDPHLPFTIGSSVHLSAYGMYGYAMLCSTDFRRTMDFATRYHQLATPLASISFEERDRLGIWTIEPVLHPKIDSQLYRFVTEVQIATHISLQRDIMGQSFRPREIGLTYPPSADFGITEALAGCPIRFEQAMNEIAFDSIFLDQAPRLDNRTTYPAIDGDRSGSDGRRRRVQLRARQGAISGAGQGRRPRSAARRVDRRRAQKWRGGPQDEQHFGDRGFGQAGAGRRIAGADHAP